MTHHTSSNKNPSTSSSAKKSSQTSAQKSSSIKSSQNNNNNLQKATNPPQASNQPFLSALNVAKRLGKKNTSVVLKIFCCIIIIVIIGLCARWIYTRKKKVKVALTRGEPAFREAADILRNTEPLPPLELNSDICIPLPATVVEIKDPAFLKEQVKTLRESMTIDIFFKDLIKLPEVSALLMIVDDSVKNPGRKRNALLNRDFKYVGINSHFIGKNFVAYFAFSK